NGKCHPTPARRAYDGGNRWFAEMILCLAQFQVELLKKRAHLRRGFAHDEIEVEPGAESSGHAACQHDRANIVIGCGAPQCRNELLEHRKVERIDWRTLDADLRNPAGRLVTNKIFHDWSILRCWRSRQARKIIEHDPEKWEPVFGKRSCS